MALKSLDQTARPPDEVYVGDSADDPLGFLAGKRYTCYCGRRCIGTMLCGDCSRELVSHLVKAAAHRASGDGQSDRDETAQPADLTDNWGDSLRNGQN